ncbi:MAG: AbrB/MazE/SpoVT family DNA-binding domain-containing protein [Anaerolineae bacterium]
MIQNEELTAQPYIVRLSGDGQITLPEELREELAVTEGDLFSLVRINSYLLLFPKRLVVPEMADKIAELAETKGVTLDDLLAGLDEVGEQLYRERYGRSSST